MWFFVIQKQKTTKIRKHVNIILLPNNSPKIFCLSREQDGFVINVSAH